MKKQLQDYLEYEESLQFSHETIRGAKYICLEFFRWLENREIRQITDIKKSDLIDWQKSLSHQVNREGLPIKAKTINSKISGVKNFLRYMVKKGIIMELLPEILRHIKEPKMLPKDICTHTEFKKLIGAIDISKPLGYRNRTMIEILYSTAIRASELTGLNLTSIDFSNKTLTVYGKGKKERVVPIGKTAIRFLETYIKAVRPLLMKRESTGALFINNIGKRLHYRTLLETIKKYAELAKIKKNIAVHTFRRSCATELVRNGANLYHVKDLLGHESLETLRHYTKLTITDLKKTHAKCHPREKSNG